VRQLESFKTGANNSFTSPGLRTFSSLTPGFVMSHGYSLRPNANGRRGRKSTDTPENISSASTCNAGPGGADAIDEREGLPVEADKGTAKPPALSSVHKKPAIPQHCDGQRLDALRQRGIATSSTITTCRGPTRYWVERPPETSEAIQEGRRRVEAKHRVEAVRIQREQLERRYRQDLSGLHDRIAMLRGDCEEEVARARLEWVRTRAIERGEAVEANEEEGDGEEGEIACDEEAETEVGSTSAPTETSSLSGHDRERRRAQTSRHHGLSLGPPLENSRPAMLGPLAPPPLQRLRRQPARLMPVTFVSGDPITMISAESGDDDDDRAEGNQDSEMGDA
jgi:hypothetical protein